VREFTRQGERNLEFLVDLYRKDKAYQEELREHFTNNPQSMREMLLRIEAGASDLEFIDGEIVDQNGNPADEMAQEAINNRVDEQMLLSNGAIREQQLQYKDGFFIPLDYRDLKEMQRTEGIR
jgi:hypothetical protein